MHISEKPSIGANGAGVYRTTRWSVVLEARNSESPHAHAALSQLCEAYWRPLYCCIRRHGHSPEDAKDLTQGFFAKLLEKDQISQADKERGRFRTFLLRSMENFLHNEHDRKQAQKRGGGCQFVSLDAQRAESGYTAEPMDQLSPSELFERRWAAELLTNVLARLRAEFTERGRDELFRALEPRLWNSESTYAAMGADLCMTEEAVKVAVCRLRKRYRELLREEIAQTVASPEEIDDELAHLRQVFAG